MSSQALNIKNLSFSFGKNAVLKDINLEIKHGEIFALIGPNGAGKSTLFRLISGLLPIQKGSIEVNGHSLSDSLSEAKASQMLLTDDPNIYPYLTGKEFIHMHASLRGIKESKVSKELPKLKKIFPTLANLEEPIGEQSRGNKQKIQIICAMLTKPKLLLSDEPIVGLDPSSVVTFGETLEEFVKEKNSVLLALHTLDFAQKYAHKVGILINGELVIIKDIGKSDLYKLYQKYTS
ncbi:MAG: ABC transporter ATP-binding protein [Candidatus Pacebacteria bacterium]|nr:ABC transporter ATP-binding protein [Candidatus Paceibacterota bacterium]